MFLVFDLDEAFVRNQQLELIKKNIDESIRVFRQDPTCLETLYISVVCFDGEKKIVYPLVELLEFSMPEIPLGRGELLNKTLESLMGEIITQTKRTTAYVRGDLNPICIIFTDSEKADSAKKEIIRWKREFKYVNTVVYTVGECPDLEVLVQLTPQVIRSEYTTYSIHTHVWKVSWDGCEAFICTESELI